MKVCARYSQSGDVTGSAETIVQTSVGTDTDLNIALVYLRRWTALIGIEVAIEKTREFAERLRALQ